MTYKTTMSRWKGKVVLKAVLVLGMSYLPTPQNSCTVWEAMELERTYFVPYRKANQRCGFYEWMHEDLRQEFRICYTKKNGKMGMLQNKLPWAHLYRTAARKNQNLRWSWILEVPSLRRKINFGHLIKMKWCWLTVQTWKSWKRQQTKNMSSRDNRLICHQSGIR